MDTLAECAAVLRRLGRVALLASLVVLVAAFLASAAHASSPGFREGDWLLYRMKVSAKSPAFAAQLGTDHVSAEAEVKVTIEKIEGDTFTVRYHVLSVRTEPQQATQLAANLRKLDGVTKQYRLDQGFDSKEIPLYVSPGKLSNGGRYTGSEGAVSYEAVYDTRTGWLRHSLVKAEVMGATLQAEMTLVEASFSGGGAAALIVVAAVVGAVAAAAVVVALKLRREAA